jgi:DNA-binding GntR family transcriptional regulator
MQFAASSHGDHTNEREGDMSRKSNKSKQATTSLLTDRIADSLRERILTMQLGPGVRLNVDDLRVMYDSSHIPIREALQRLEAEGLVTRLPNKGTHVASVDAPDALDLIDLRAQIEPVVASRALARQTASDVTAARRAFTQLRKVDKQGKLPEFAEAHQQYHRSLLQPGLTPVYERHLTMIWQGLNRLMRYFYTIPEFSMGGSEQHEQMLTLWSARDPAFVTALSHHIATARTAIAQVCNMQQGGHLPRDSQGTMELQIVSALSKRD